ncbi:2-phosphosulfolactate phosphatase [soil metagenome]
MIIAIVRPDDPPNEVDVCIVIDVLRATTTAAVLCDRMGPTGELVTVGSPSDLARLPPRARGYAIFSELAELADDDAPGQRFDNSPTVARDVELAGRTPVLVTTNGTVAIELAKRFAREVVLASFANLTAALTYVRERGPRSVAVMPAGNIREGQRVIEDDGCAEVIRGMLAGEAVDVEAVLAGCRRDARIVRRSARIPDDVAYCLALDAVAVVPHVVESRDRNLTLLRMTVGKNRSQLA